MHKLTNSRMAWGRGALLAGTLLMGLRLCPYLVAIYGGRYAYLPGAVLTGVPPRGVNLNDAVLRGAHLEGADMRGAHLNRTDLHHAHLSRAELSGAFLDGIEGTGADFHGADLQRAILSADGKSERGPELCAADFHGADLRGASFQDANLQQADLTAADLRGAQFSDCRLDGANLTGARLAHVLYGPQTRWPSGFDPRQHGARLIGPKEDLCGLDLDGFQAEY
jgi:uncharacterized protein YjbI with pentapeptide repeats